MPFGFGPGFGGGNAARGFGRGFARCYGAGFGGGFGRGLGICKWAYFANSSNAPYIKDALEFEKRILEERIKLIDDLLKDDKKEKEE